MLRKKFITGAVLVGMIMVAGIGCTNQESEKAVNAGNTGNNPSINELNTDELNSTTNEQHEVEESFYGDWQIEKILAFAPVSAYSEDDLKAILGKQLTFSKESANCFGDELAQLNQTAIKPAYEKSIRAKNDFEADSRVTFDSLGIESDSITEISAVDAEGNGCLLYQKDNNTLILYGGGVFLELKKK